MALVALSAVLQLLAVCCFAIVAAHAFGRSVGTGFLVLLVPFYQVVYGVTQFEHRFKGALLAGWLGAGGLAIVLRFSGLAMG